MEIEPALFDLVENHFIPYVNKLGYDIQWKGYLSKISSPNLEIKSYPNEINFDLIKFFKNENILNKYSKDTIFKFLTYFNHAANFYECLLQEGETTIIKSLIDNDEMLIDYVVEHADFIFYLTDYVPFSLFKPEVIKSIIQKISQNTVFNDVDFQKDIYNLLPSILDDYKELLSLFDIKPNQEIQAQMKKTEMIYLNFNLTDLYNFNLKKNYYIKNFNQALPQIKFALLEYKKELNLIEVSTSIEKDNLIISCEGLEVNEQLLEQVTTSHLKFILAENDLSEFEKKLIHIDNSIIEKFILDSVISQKEKQRKIKL